MIEKMRINNEHTRSTLVIDGNEASNAFTTSLIPSFLEIILSGLSALNALSDFKAYSELVSNPIISMYKSTIDAVTTKASSEFQ